MQREKEREAARLVPVERSKATRVQRQVHVSRVRDEEEANVLAIFNRHDKYKRGWLPFSLTTNEVFHDLGIEDKKIKFNLSEQLKYDLEQDAADPENKFNHERVGKNFFVAFWMDYYMAV